MRIYFMSEHRESGQSEKKRIPAGAERGAASSNRSSANKKDPPPSGLMAWWPLAAGIALDLVIPQLSAQLEPYQPWGIRAVFPFAQITGMRELGFSEQLTQSLPQLMLYLQFPLEGLLTGFSLSRGTKLGAAIGQLVFLHALCLFVMWLVAQKGQ